MVLSVVVAEDNLLLREGVVELLRRSGADVRAAVDGYEALLEAVRVHDPDVVVTDIRMPPGSSDEGVRAARALRTISPRCGVVVLSQHASAKYAVALLDGGSEGRAYLLKDRVSEPDQLFEAVRAVAEGRSIVDPKVVDELVAARTAATASPLAFLTVREREVLALMAQGASNGSIAERLALSDRAVEKHINAIFGKLALSEELDVNRRVKAVLVFLADRSAQEAR
jgi:DNA-binding NarL/FixJ family response regulator